MFSSLSSTVFWVSIKASNRKSQHLVLILTTVFSCSLQVSPTFSVSIHIHFLLHRHLLQQWKFDMCLYHHRPWTISCVRSLICSPYFPLPHSLSLSYLRIPVFVCLFASACLFMCLFVYVFCVACPLSVCLSLSVPFCPSISWFVSCSVALCASLSLSFSLFVSVQLCLWVSVYVYVCVWMCVCMCVHMCVHCVYPHTHTHTCNAHVQVEIVFEWTTKYNSEIFTS